MIPVPENCVQLLNVSEQEQKYRTLLNKQILFINENEERIRHKALVAYNSVVKRTNKFLMSICCNFKDLEEHYKNYQK